MTRRITRSTRLDELLDLSYRAHNELGRAGGSDGVTVGELVDLGWRLRAMGVGRKVLSELAAALPRKWGEKILAEPPTPTREQITGSPTVQRVRVHCTACDHVASVVSHRYAEPCSRCGGKVERRPKGWRKGRARAVAT